MLLPNLPFSREFIKHLHITTVKSNISGDNFTIIELSGSRFKIHKDVKSIREDAIFFGKYKNENLFFIENDSLFEEDSFNIISEKIDEESRGVAGIARSFSIWHSENIYCGKCGGSLLFSNKETAKVCSKCSFTVYPRLNPAVIVGVKKGPEILLTRKREWQRNRYGVVAGFIEYGESAEEAVNREVFEETGIEINNLKYITTQFWPFPYQIMIGFLADYSAGELKVDRCELEEAGWFHKDHLPGLPPATSISRFLIDTLIDRL